VKKRQILEGVGERQEETRPEVNDREHQINAKDKKEEVNKEGIFGRKRKEKHKPYRK
jgi:hypothetical protein